MSEEVKKTNSEKEREINMTVKVPESVHRKLKFYGTKIGALRQRDYKVDEAYSEALIEFTSGITITE